MPKEATAHLPSWAAPFIRPARYKTAYGGRGSSKTWTFAMLIVSRCFSETTNVVCARTVERSTGVSVRLAFKKATERLGISWAFEFRDWKIECRHNGSEIRFLGIERKREEIRGWEDVDIAWIEEAHLMSDATAEILVPTMRKPGSELWFTWNPKHRTDWVWRRFVENPREGDVIRKVNFSDNKWFTPELESERAADEKYNPSIYPHIWLGEPDDMGADRQVLPYDLLAVCVDAFNKGLHSNSTPRPVDMGLDIANGGADKNAMVVRRGPVVIHASEWASEKIDDLKPTAERAANMGMLEDVGRVWYDANGVGAGMGGELSRTRLTAAKRRIMAGQAVAGGPLPFNKRLTNSEMFFNRGSQLAWALRMAAQNTLRLERDGSANPDHCLFIDPRCSTAIDSYLGQLSRPTWRESAMGQVQLVKHGDDSLPSPDLFDATAMAFARMSHNGLKLRLAQ